MLAANATLTVLTQVPGRLTLTHGPGGRDSVITRVPSVSVSLSTVFSQCRRQCGD